MTNPSTSAPDVPGAPDAPDAPAISATWSVNDTILRVPDAVKVFNAFGVDACCGGAATLAQAAADANVPVAALLDALAKAAESGASRSGR